MINNMYVIRCFERDGSYSDVCFYTNLEAAQEHCSHESTHGDEWFHGYEEVTNDYYRRNAEEFLCFSEFDQYLKMANAG
jgi:hypothetical protein